MIRDRERALLSRRLARSWRPFLFAHSPVLILALLCLSSCATSAGRSSSKLPSGSSLREGSITYHDPSPAGGLFQRNSRTTRAPITIGFVTGTTGGVDSDESGGADTGAVVQKGKIGPGFRGDRHLSPSVAREILKHTNQQNPRRRVSTRDFAEIWESLIAAGIDELPVSRDGQAPADVPSIHLKTEQSQWIFVKPPPLSRSDGGESARSKEKQLKTWIRCVVTLQTLY